jgi:hypothetical protein
MEGRTGFSRFWKILQAGAFLRDLGFGIGQTDASERSLEGRRKFVCEANT